MRVAIEGCSHGELDNIYASIQKADQEQSKKTELVLLCGDFQAIRNAADLHCLAVPEKYKQIGDFHRYYSGEKQAPYLTIVIGGNHEASNYMWELFMGGWLAPNVYYLGAAGCVSYKGLVIAGISGIYKSGDYYRGHFERMPYGPSDIRSIYHTRKFDVQRLSLLNSLKIQPDIFLSHDWPNTIEQYGDTQTLIKRKPFFRDEIRSQSLGSPPLMELLRKLRPRYWFSAHLHCKFAAKVEHETSHEGGTTAQDAGANGTAASGETRFLALGKCVPNQEFLQIIDIEPSNPPPSIPESSEPSLSYVPEWLAILQHTQSQLSLHREQRDVQAEGLTDLVEEQRQKISSEENAQAVTGTQSFLPTAPPLKESLTGPDGPPPWYTNPQTVALSARLGIEININAPPKQLTAPPPMPVAAAQAPVHAPKVESAVSDIDEIQRIREAAAARKRKREEASAPTQTTADATQVELAAKPDAVLSNES